VRTPLPSYRPTALPTYRLTALLLALAGAVGCSDDTGPSAPNPPPSTTPPAVTLTIGTDATGPSIPADFLGLGFEMPVMADPRLNSPALEQLLRNVGPGTLRFGGNSVQKTVWRPNVQTKSGFFQLTPANVDATFGFAGRIGWRVAVDVALPRSDPAEVVSESAYLVQTGGDRLLSIELGNEPNLYPSNGIRSANYTVDSFTTEFDAAAAAIREQVPAAPLAAPSSWCTGGGAWFADFLDGTGTPLAYATEHFYPMGVPAPARSVEEATVANMLSPELMARSRACVDSAAGPALARGLALRVDETNSAFGFGEPGVSDVFASALWGLDHLFTLAELGVAGVNLQTGTDINGGLTCRGIYLPVCDAGGGRWTARPLYYAMLLFHQAAVGRAVPVQVGATPETNVVAHATVADDGSVRVVVINKEEAAPATVAIQLGSTGAQATVLRLSASSLLARNGVTLGGTAVASDGTWSPGTLEPATPDGGQYVVTVPPASAMLVTVGR
jgi:hypothetical protein